MVKLLSLIPFLPLTGCLVLVATEGKLAKRWVAFIGVGSVGLAALLAALVGIDFLSGLEERSVFRQTLWTWMAAGQLQIPFAFYLDALSLNMLWVVTGVGFLIHVYSAGYMADDPGFSRFFAYMNLFVFAMLVLVLADNLPLLYLGWEGVGLCSYLLIGFWHDDPANGHAARKAFVVTRIGDAAMAVGLFLLFAQLGTLDVQQTMSLAQARWPVGSGYAVAAALLLLGGAVGKSAQLPLQVWLPDAMAGPTPVSALIHAATMVTAGVYLIARTHVLFSLAPEIQTLVGFIGCVTLLLSGFSALTQSDIKRILAYSTMSQIGYMFLALGVGAWSAAILHLTTHAFFKALLFMAAGAVIVSLHHEQDIFRMGGLRQKLPIAFWSFVIGSAALIALPLTSGYSSKHAILAGAWAHEGAGAGLWGLGVLGALLTGLYSTRLLLVTFFGPQYHEGEEHLPLTMTVPLVILGVLSLVGGLATMPLDSVFRHHEPGNMSAIAGFVATAAPLLGMGGAVWFYGVRRYAAERFVQNRLGFATYRLLLKGWCFDPLYEVLFVRPYSFLARINRADIVDTSYQGLVWLSTAVHGLLSSTQTGGLRWYAAGIVLGVVLILALGVRP